jgi:DNA topoisomerase-1
MDVAFTAQMESDLDGIAVGEQEWVPVLSAFWGGFSETLAKAEATMAQVEISDQPTGEVCPECGGALVFKWGRYGRFVGCSNYPDCRFRKAHLEKIGVECPECGGDMVARRTRRGRTFFGCGNYPDCKFATWKRPVPAPCPACGGLLVLSGRDVAQCTVCEDQFPRETVEVDVAPVDPVPA